ncbi:hypothetical protein J2W30_003663 [Variovorax boronicumulans]|uniref:hypothetical protein n=1 Tax=Variovorax boronicumulans TaxID=436515 RepID=UPI0027815E75|nr:hypothetical protein [Variovorax boronicumulans]MDQ0035890.1 hypothetical protein [Variovorax boronicumulans]
MIRVFDSNSNEVYLAAEAIASVVQAGASSQWHGIRSFVKTFDGRTIEAQETASEIAAAVEAERKAK